jgi:hypothetical protein
MSTSLKQDVCGQQAPGTRVDNVGSSQIERYLPPEVRYACLYWIQHLQKSDAQLCDKDQVHQFLQVHLLHWLEALGWAAAAKDRVKGQVSREVGQRDITITIDIYLAAKKKDSKGELSRTKLLDYCRQGKQWFFLTGPSPLLVFIFSPAIDIIVYILPHLSLIPPRRDLPPQRQNNSITDPTI